MAFKLSKDIPQGTTFAYRSAPRSGNEINGLGETEPRRASHVFHNDGDDALPWDQLDNLFGYVMHWKVAYWIMRNMWNLRRATGPAAARRQEISDPDQMTSEIMARAKTLGADLVGVTDVKPHHVYEGHEVPYRFAISIGVEMDRGRMAGIPDNVAAGEVMRAYAQVGRVVGLLSEEIRRKGWPARAYGNPNSGDLLQIPVAIDCGFGQLGKHGSLISKEHGSNFRLGCVVTDLGKHGSLISKEHGSNFRLGCVVTDLPSPRPIGMSTSASTTCANDATSAFAAVPSTRSTTSASSCVASTSGTSTSTSASTTSARRAVAASASKCAPGVSQELARSSRIGCFRLAHSAPHASPRPAHRRGGQADSSGGGATNLI